MKVSLAVGRERRLTASAALLPRGKRGRGGFWTRPRSRAPESFFCKFGTRTRASCGSGGPLSLQLFNGNGGLKHLRGCIATVELSARCRILASGLA
eukprot:scaffold73379_cov28-Tisochrysis_lutea.AAC.1